MNIPEEFSSLQDFAMWYTNNGYPMLPPVGVEPFRTDDASAFCTFRKGRYQAEVYLVDDSSLLPFHEHPGLEVIVIQSQNKIDNAWSPPLDILYTNEAHGGGNIGGDLETDITLVLSKWHVKATPHTVSAVWKGKTAGPKHEELIRRFFPNAFIKDGYADITRKNNE